MTEDKKPGKAELLAMLDEMLKRYEELPQHAQIMPITHYDLEALIILLRAIFRAEA